MIYLHKILPLIASPLFLIFFLIILGTIIKSKKITLFGVVILIFCSLPIISDKLINYLEKDYTLQDASAINNADVIVVLSGMLKTIKVDDKLKYEFDDGVDRILSGIDLFKNNKASLLILTKGQVPWSLGIPEGEYLKDFAIKFGVPKKSILLTENVQNTDQEAKSVKKLLNSNDVKVILVTSAFHMPRAKKVFEASNIKVIPFAVDFINSHQKLTFMSFLPSADALSSTSIFVREMIGRLYYNLKY
ncbi:YdcF family protein [Candidatus Pelagibacter sp. Uisw_090]|uniref:YdcF family protein n=1 Tax=Candidatus Pelagibacter sp. Uisw_090 TaxID=3230993 RepID=UPI0039E9BB2F